jgi:hypothetical protein
VASEGTHHVVKLEHLTAPPDRRVHYRLLLDGKSAGEGNVALPDRNRPLTFLVYGDTRDNQVGSALARLAQPLGGELILYTGDLVRNGGDVKYWLSFFHDEASLLADVPLYPTLGNHELFRDPTGANFRRFFVLPAHDDHSFYYAFDFGPARFIVLDGNHVDDKQTAWLKDELEGSERDGVPNVFVLEHQPALSVGAHCGEALAQADWVELFERHRVRAVFAGHDHAYERMERNGVRYFVSGGGGAELYAESACAALDRAARRVYLPVHHLLRVRVSGPEVTVEALPLDGGVPLDVTRFSRGEAMFATDAPPLRRGEKSAGWSIAGGCIAFALVGLFLRRRRRRMR